MEDPLRAVLGRLKGYKESATKSDEFYARCPAHDDDRMSLTVGVGRVGQVLLKCHAGGGCSFESIVEALGLEPSDLWPPDDGRAPRPSVSAAGHSANGRHVVAEYGYRDEAGVLVFQAVRFSPKGFGQRRPDGKEGWIWNLQGVQPMLYRLPELLGSGEETVWVCEGEKDVETLRGLGLTATCNPMGAGKWKASYSNCLKGRKVVVLPDNDDAGRNHALDVAKSLDDVAASCVVLELPGLPAKGDVTDWVSLGGTREELERLASEAKPRKRRVATLQDLATAGSRVSWAWEGWVPTGVLTAMAGEGGTGKTRFCADLIRRVKNQLPWPDGTPMNLPADSVALWVMADNHHDEMVSLCEAFGITDSVRVNAWDDDPFGGVSLDDPEDLAELEKRIAECRPAFVIIDTVGNATDRNLGRQEDAKAFYFPLQVLARRYRCAILCLTHLNANGKFLGRRVLEKVRVAIRIIKPDPNDDRRRLEIPKSNSKRPESLGLKMSDHGNDYDTNPPSEPEESQGEPAQQEQKPNSSRGRKPEKLDACKAWLKEQLALGSRRLGNTIREAESKGFSMSTLYAAKNALKVEEFESEGRKWWELTNQSEEITGGSSGIPE